MFKEKETPVCSLTQPLPSIPLLCAKQRPKLDSIQEETTQQLLGTLQIFIWGTGWDLISPFCLWLLSQGSGVQGKAGS